VVAVPSKHGPIDQPFGFQVEMFTYGENVGWATLVRRLHSTHFTQAFLRPGRSYLFLVRAENSHGLSPPSHLSGRVTLPTEYHQNVPYSHDMSIAKSTLFGGHIVDLIDIKTVSSTSIKLFWEVRNTAHPSNTIIGIILFYTRTAEVYENFFFFLMCPEH
jgi:hypothetical protein